MHPKGPAVKRAANIHTPPASESAAVRDGHATVGMGWTRSGATTEPGVGSRPVSAAASCCRRPRTIRSAARSWGASCSRGAMRARRSACCAGHPRMPGEPGLLHHACGDVPSRATPAGRRVLSPRAATEPGLRRGACELSAAARALGRSAGRARLGRRCGRARSGPDRRACSTWRSPATGWALSDAAADAFARIVARSPCATDRALQPGGRPHGPASRGRSGRAVPSRPPVEAGLSRCGQRAGNALRVLGQWDEALAWARLRARAEPGLPDALGHLAILMRSVCDWTACRSWTPGWPRSPAASSRAARRTAVQPMLSLWMDTDPHTRLKSPHRTAARPASAPRPPGPRSRSKAAGRPRARSPWATSRAISAITPWPSRSAACCAGTTARRSACTRMRSARRTAARCGTRSRRPATGSSTSRM